MPEVVRIKRLDGRATDVVFEVVPPLDVSDLLVYMLYMDNQAAIRSATVPNGGEDLAVDDFERIEFDSTDFRGRGWRVRPGSNDAPCLTITMVFRSSGITCPATVVMRYVDRASREVSSRELKPESVARVVFLTP